MSVGETIFEEGALRLVRSNGRNATLFHGDTELLTLVLTPAWYATSPMRTARLALAAMRPHAPAFEPDGKGKGLIGGLYLASADLIKLYQRERLTDDEVAEVILHELCHSTGHPSRLHRPYFNWSDADAKLNPDDFSTPSREFTDESAEKQQEEITARIGTALLSVRLGIIPCGGAHWFRWMPRCAALPLELLSAAIRDARASARFICGGTATESPNIFPGGS